MKTSFFLEISAVSLLLALSGCDGTRTEPIPVDTESELGIVSTDPEPDTLRAALCSSEVVLEMSPVKSSLTVVLDRTKWFFQSKLSTSVYDAVGEFVHQMEAWTDLAFFVFPGRECVDLAETDPVLGCSVSDNLLFGFGTENPGDVLDAELLGWSGLGFCGIEAVTPALNRTLQYLNASPARAESDILLVTSTPAACDPSIPPAAPIEDCYCPAGRELDCAQSGLHCTVLGPIFETVLAYTTAGYRLHISTFSTDVQMNGWGRQFAIDAGTYPNFFASQHADVAHEFDEMRKRFYSCQFKVDWSTVPPEVADDLSQGLVNLFVDHQPIGYDQTCASGNGWEWLDADKIGLCPNTCAILVEDNVMSSVVFETSHGCESYVDAAE